MTNSSRYHGEIKLRIGPDEARINVFSDSIDDLFLDLTAIQAQFSQADPVSTPARPHRASQPMSANGRPLPPNVNRPPPDDGLPPEVPTCKHCGNWDGMELIEFTSKKDGKQKRAWKCQACDEWHFPEKKGK